jgi:hypothetical protein
MVLEDLGVSFQGNLLMRPTRRAAASGVDRRAAGRCGIVRA